MWPPNPEQRDLPENTGRRRMWSRAGEEEQEEELRHLPQPPHLAGCSKNQPGPTEVEKEGSQVEKEGPQVEGGASGGGEEP